MAKKDYQNTFDYERQDKVKTFFKILVVAILICAGASYLYMRFVPERDRFYWFNNTMDMIGLGYKKSVETVGEYVPAVKEAQQPKPDKVQIKSNAGDKKLPAKVPPKQ